jgi:glycosyltransferase involved in cell wall biosynthesis
MNDISVLTPSYGYGRFIRDALESVARQDGVIVEHIVQDASSKDETIDVLREFGDRVIWRSEADRGQSDGLNKALHLAHGDWIGWLNADEFYFPGGLEALILAATRSGVDVVYADSVFVDEAGRLLRLYPQHRFSPFVLRYYGPYIPSGSTLFRRNVLGDDPWDSEVRRVMDWELYLRLFSSGARFLHIPYPVTAFRIHAAQITAQPPETHAVDALRVRSRHGIAGNHHPTTPARWLHRAYKLTAGAYRRQFAASRMRGADMRWFKPDVGTAAFEALLERSYRRRLAPGRGA